MRTVTRTFSIGDGQELTLFDEPRDEQRPAINIAAFDGATVRQLDFDSRSDT